MNEKRTILFLCTGNCCRSQMGEAILRYLDPVHFRALSAGSQPAGFVHPLVFETMEAMHIPVIDQHSKSWEKYFDQPIDLLITLCNEAANEVCPIWPNRPPTAHWPLPDPSFMLGPDRDQLTAALRVAERLRLKIQRLIALDWKRYTANELAGELEKIAEL